MEIVIKNNQRRIRINPHRIERFLKKAVRHLIRKAGTGSAAKLRGVSGKGASPPVEISILLVNDRQMRKLNLDHRRIDKPTDVLSFPQMSEGDEPLPAPCLQLGDIVVNVHQAERQAAERGTTVYDEVKWLLLHGLLHLVGYDHETNRYQAKRMRVLEGQMLREIKDT